MFFGNISERIKKYKAQGSKPSGGRDPRELDNMKRNARSGQTHTGVNSVPGESEAQTEYRYKKIEAARERARAAKQSLRGPGTSPAQSTAGTGRTTAVRPKNYPRTTEEEGGGLAPPAKRTGPKNYPRTTEEEGGGLAPSKGLMKRREKDRAQAARPDNKSKAAPKRKATLKDKLVVQGAKVRKRSKDATARTNRASTNEKRGRVAAGQRNSGAGRTAQEAVAALKKKRKNK